MIYLIGSLRNPTVLDVAAALREKGHKVFDDWYAAGEIADDSWRDYEKQRGRTYAEALQCPAAKHVFEFDMKWLKASSTAVLVLPAGKSSHLELGWMLGQGKRGFVLLEPEHSRARLPEDWLWLTALYEGEGSLTRNGKKNGHGMQLTITMKDEDIIRRAQRISSVGSIEGPYTRNNPKWSPMWRWAVRRKADILYTINGMWERLGIRRQQQVLAVLKAAGVSEEERAQAERPHVFRYDVMYQFATAVCANVDELITAIEMPYVSKPGEAPEMVRMASITPWCLLCGLTIYAGHEYEHARCRGAV